LLGNRIGDVYGHVRRGPVEILSLQLYDMALVSISLRPKRSVSKMKDAGILTLGDFEGQPRSLLRSLFPPVNDGQIAVVHWLEGMLQMIGIRLQPR
jgi:hypothetical protein